MIKWFAGLSLGAKILLSFFGLVVFAAFVPSGEQPKTPPLEPPSQDLTQETDVSGEALGDETQKTPEPIPTPEPEPEPEPEIAPTPTPAPITTSKPAQKPKPKPAPKPAPSCEPSYTNVCIPIGSADYDCAGGSGNGPNYIAGPVYVRHDVPNPDPHGLDRGGEYGVGCEN